MHQVEIFPIKQYEDLSAIQEAIKAIFHINPELINFLKASTTDRLVVVKPNWVQPNNDNPEGGWEELITNPVITVSTVKVLAELMGGRGTICVCDAPHTMASFSSITGIGDIPEQLKQIQQSYPELNIELVDLRREVWTTKDGVITKRSSQEGDPRGYVALNLDRESWFYEHEGEGHYYGADYDSKVVNSHHHGTTHEYLISGTPIKCDLFVCVPKLKTHKKTGITCSLKNLVGINGDKNWLPHHTEGKTGDEYPSIRMSNLIEFKIKKLLHRFSLAVPGLGTWLLKNVRKVGKQVLDGKTHTIRAGNWHGNNTCWRMVLDLNRTLLYGNSDTTWRNNEQPKFYVSIVDGIVGGEGLGPCAPERVESQVLFGGTNPAVVDLVAAHLMGFATEHLQVIQRAFDKTQWPIANCPQDTIQILDHRTDQIIGCNNVAPAIQDGFRPAPGWSILNPKKEQTQNTKN